MDTGQTNEFNDIPNPEDTKNWSAEDWIKYFSKDGWITPDEFIEYAVNLTMEKMREKFGDDYEKIL